MEKIVQDQLGDYRENPDPRVWDRIRSSLEDRKKPRRVIPIWLRWGAAAAILVAGLFWWTQEAETGPELPSVTRSVPAGKPQTEKPAETPTRENTPPLMDREGVASGEEGGSGMETDSPVPAPTGAPARLSGQKAGRNANRGLAKAEDRPYKDSAEERTEIPEKRLAEIPATPLKEDLPKGQTEGVTPPADENRALAEAAGEEPPKKSIFEAVAEQEQPPKTKTPRGRWAIGPSLAPVYFNSMGNGSPISSNFVDNAKSGTFNMSYGLQVSYQLSSRLSLRSGVHRVDYGYNTDDVGFTSSPAATPGSLIRTISYSENSKNLVVHSTAGSNPPPQRPEAIDISAPSAAREGQMLQEFGYLEVPLEMQYSLIDRKWGVNLIGGVSSLFLLENSVSLESGGAVTEMGEANNMNALNFSTNFGVGMFYRLNPRFEISLQPMFKYQLNTFSQTSGNFQPYSIGVYSGLNFRF